MLSRTTADRLEQKSVVVLPPNATPKEKPDCYSVHLLLQWLHPQGALRQQLCWSQLDTKVSVQFGPAVSASIKAF
jgi:hypothetical protein